MPSHTDIKKDNLITVVICTFRRPLYLSCLLDSLIQDLKLLQHSGKVTVHVRVNPDPQYENEYDTIAQRYASYSYIQFTTNEENIGSQASFFRALSGIKTKYFVSIGDDDYVEPGFLCSILQELPLNPDIIIMNYRVEKTLNKKKHSVLSPPKLNRLPAEPNFSLKLFTHSMYLGLTSCLVFKKDAYELILREVVSLSRSSIEAPLINQLLPLYIAMCIICDQKARSIGMPYLIARQSSTGSYYTNRSVASEYFRAILVFTWISLKSSSRKFSKLFMVSSVITSFTCHYYSKFFAKMILYRIGKTTNRVCIRATQ